MNQGPFPNGYAYAPPDAQELKDNEHVRLLRIFYFISAAQTALFIPLGLFYAGMGLMFLNVPGPSAGSGPASAAPWMMSGIFGVFGLTFAFFFAIGAGLKLMTAIRLKERRSRTLCLVTAGLTCLEMPYGTALGIMTFVVLGRDSVRRQFID
jgi:hypothetical protein